MLYATSITDKIQLFFAQRKINKQKEAAREVLRKLKILDSNAVVLGGAPRDWFFGKPAKDIDFYISGSTDHVLNSLNELGLKVSAIKRKSDLCTDNTYSAMDSLICVIDMKYKGHDCQIMITDNQFGEQLVDYFPCSLSKVSFDLITDVQATWEFAMCVDLGINYVHSDNGYELDHPYIKKIIDKFPFFKHELASEEKLNQEYMKYIKGRNKNWDYYLNKC